VKLHRVAKIPPCGPPRNGTRLVLCGRYVRADRYTDELELVDCETCLRTATSERTARQNRLAS